MTWSANENRYRNASFRRTGNSGLMLPPVSLGLWHNFGGQADYSACRDMVCGAFDLGMTHMDLANNYGPPAGAAEETFGRIMKADLAPWRDELIISTKAGYGMWPGPYGDFGSRKYLLASLDASLRRMGLDYVDIYYHHRPDPQTPLEETMGALAQAVRSGKALYAAVSNYDAPRMLQAAALLRDMKIPFIANQVRYHMFDRWIEDSLVQAADESGVGLVIFSPLAQGILTDRYLDGIPADSRAGTAGTFLQSGDVTDDKLDRVRALRDLAAGRGQTLAQLALAFVLRHRCVATAIIGASRMSQIADCQAVDANMSLDDEELAAILDILG